MSNDEIGNLPSLDPPADQHRDPATPWRAVPDILPAGQPAEGLLDVRRQGRETRARRWAVAGGAGALVLALVGGVTYAVGALSGGGAQPADALPSGAFGYVSIDLDPTAGQKVDGFRFLRSFPSLRDSVPVNGDVRKVFFTAVADQAGWSGIDYDSDVAPWLGQRVALAAYPATGAAAATTGATGVTATGAPSAVVALQVSDTTKAEQGLRRLVRASSGRGSHVGWAFSGGYALLSDSTATARRMADRVSEGTLAADPHFAADLAAAPDGVATAWIDGDKATSSLGRGAAMLSGAGVLGGLAGTAGLVGGASSAGAPAVGRTTVVAHFDGSHVFEITGRVTGAATSGWSTHAVHGVDTLPGDSAVAVGISDPDLLVGQTYTALSASLRAQGLDMAGLESSVAASTGLALPRDLQVLLGHNLTLAVSPGGAGGPAVGARMTTDAAAAAAVLDKVRAALGVSGAAVPLVDRTAGTDYVVATTTAQGDALAGVGSSGAGGPSTLGDVTAFHDALPDLAATDVAVWIDPRAVLALAGSGSNADKDIDQLAGLGITATSRAGGDSTFRLRLVTR